MRKKIYVAPSCSVKKMVTERGILAGSQSPWADSKEVIPDVWDNEEPPTTETLWPTQRVNHQSLWDDNLEE